MLRLGKDVARLPAGSTATPSAAMVHTTIAAQYSTVLALLAILWDDHE